MHGYVSSSLAEARLLLLHSSLYAVRCASTILSVTPHLSILEKKIRSASHVDSYGKRKKPMNQSKRLE